MSPLQDHHDYISLEARTGAPSAPHDPRHSLEFVRRVMRYLGPKSAVADVYSDSYREHTGKRSEWFRSDLIWRLESTRPIAGLRVLDFGCGTGSSTVVMAERGATVIGIETEAFSISVAIQRARDLRVADRCSFVHIPYVQRGRASLPFQDGTVDLCALIGVLEHMRQSERIDCAAEIHRVLAPGGEVFIFDTPNRAHPFDHHTTRLWFAGWMPVALARRYAILRKRFDASHDFGRDGATGITRRVIDRLFPAPQWTVTYEKPAELIALEFGWLGKRLSALPPSWREGAGRLLQKTSRRALQILQRLGFRPAWWASSHSLTLRKMPDP